MPLKEFKRKVSTKMDGFRLDRYLVRSGVSITRSNLQRLIRNGAVTVNGKKVRPSHKIRPGDIVEAHYETKPPLKIKPQQIPLDVIFEDRHLIVINKEKGIVVHPARGHPDHTMVNALLYHCGNLPSGSSKLRPGVVHRLDKDTTGLIVFAKTDHALSRLGIMVERRKFERKYLALVWGDFPTESFEIDAPIGRDTIDRRKMAVTPLGSKEARTFVEVVERFGCVTKLEVSLRTGRTHQIRTHLKHLGHPVLGDPDYGGRSRSLVKDDDEYCIFKKVMKVLDRQALHAVHLSFMHPIRKRRMEFNAPLPEDIVEVMDILRKECK